MKHARADYDRIQDPAGKIPADEPVFLIRGQDRVAPAVLECWATLAAAAGASPQIVEAARFQANEMRHWQSTCANKTPDMP